MESLIDLYKLIYLKKKIFGIHFNLRSAWLGEWKSGRIKNIKRMEKWENKKDCNFPHLCLIGKMEKWMNGKLFCFVENKVCIN